MRKRIMSHLVAFYPDEKATLKVADAFVAGGCSYLEVQFPFSDPTADGRFIEHACTKALRAGFKVDKGFKLVKKIKDFTDVPLFIMSYAEIVFVRGIDKFIDDSLKAGAQGLIIPDLPPDYDEGLYQKAKETGIEVIPVVAPSISDERLKLMATTGNKYLYTALRKGITGEYTEIDQENLEFINKITKYDVKIIAGFGIKNAEQVRALSKYVHAVVVGSEFIRIIEETYEIGKYHDALYKKMKELAGE